MLVAILAALFALGMCACFGPADSPDEPSPSSTTSASASTASSQESSAQSKPSSAAAGMANSVVAMAAINNGHFVYMLYDQNWNIIITTNMTMGMAEALEGLDEAA